MKQRMKQLILSACTFILFGHIHFASADIASDTERLLNWAETTYPDLFRSRQATINIEPWLYRYYPETQIYAGVNKNDNDVYVLGGDFGNTPTRIDTLANLVSQIPNSGGNIAGCDTANVPAGIVYSQSGNVVTVTTNGQCIAADLNTNICEVPQQTTASGISVLSSNNPTVSRIEGISIPGFPDLLQSLTNANTKHCTINATAETTNLIVHSDLCLDITSTITGLLESIPKEGIVVTPPVRYFTAGTYTSQTVADCFTTDATTINDAFTGEAWIKQNGNFVKVGN